MASNRSNAKTRSATPKTPADALAAVARHAMRIQIAGSSAAGRALSGWAQAANRYAQAIGDELLRRIDGESDSRELIVGVAVATNAHLRELTALPSAAADHFDTRLSRVPTDT